MLIYICMYIYMLILVCKCRLELPDCEIHFFKHHQILALTGLGISGLLKRLPQELWMWASPELDVCERLVFLFSGPLEEFTFGPLLLRIDRFFCKGGQFREFQLACF